MYDFTIIYFQMLYKPVFFNILYHFHCNICIGFPVKRNVLIKNVCKNFSPKFEKYTFSYYWLPYISYKVSSVNSVLNQYNIICPQFSLFLSLVCVTSIQYTCINSVWRNQMSIKSGIWKMVIALFSDNLTCHDNQGLCRMFLHLTECQSHLKTKPNSKVKTL